MRKKLTVGVAAISAGLLVLAGCSSSDDGGDGALKVAAAFSGPTTDADYNALGLEALKAQEGDGASVSYSESVPVPDIERVVQEYVADGNDIVWTHGSQFYEATEKVALQNPDVNFIGEFDGIPENQPDNMWVIDRNFHTVFYPIGTLAAHLTQTGKVGYLGGLSLPFSYSEVHAMDQAISDSGIDVDLNPVWSGDFNDTVKAQQLTAQLLADGNDVVVTSLNLGAVGAFQAFNNKEPGEAWITVKYTDKSENDPDHYAGTALYDFKEPLGHILNEISNGTTKGYYQISFGQGATAHMSDAIPDDVRAAVQAAVDGITDGSITVQLDQTEVE